MVLQRGKPIPIWGKAAPGAKVAISFASNQNHSLQADKNGLWKLDLDACQAGGPWALTVRSGSETIAWKDIMIGEVWVCSGQSNMEWPTRSANDPKEEIAAAKYPHIRLFKVARAIAMEPAAKVKGGWQPCTPESVAGFSAVGYFFGREMHRHLEVPIGLIQSAWGGTPSEAWTSSKAVKAEPAFKPIADRWKKVAADASAAQEKYQQQVENWKNAVTKAKAKGEKAPSRPRAPRGPNSPHNVSVLYNGMIAPLVGYAIRGAIWYQGESNASRAYQYSKIFPAMITDWRDRWGQGDFPFLFVQLANFSVRNSVTWAELREAQNMALDLPSTGVAVAIDIGNPRDIHPRNKQEVGRRLALSAVGQFHGKDLVWSGPSYTGMKVRGKVVRLSFDHVAGGMAARGGGELKGFTIAGADKKFVPARARIVKDTVLVEGDVARPVAVRYAWESNPDCNLINDAGLPASPFRTDDWEWMTANAK